MEPPSSLMQTKAKASPTRLYRQGINVPLDCTNGVCGTCKAFRQSGEFDPGSYLEDALSDAEAAEGYVLCCRQRRRATW